MLCILREGAVPFLGRGSPQFPSRRRPGSVVGALTAIPSIIDLAIGTLVSVNLRRHAPEVKRRGRPD